MISKKKKRLMGLMNEKQAGKTYEVIGTVLKREVPEDNDYRRDSFKDAQPNKTSIFEKMLKTTLTFVHKKVKSTFTLSFSLYKDCLVVYAEFDLSNNFKDSCTDDNELSGNLIKDIFHFTKHEVFYFGYEEFLLTTNLTDEVYWLGKTQSNHTKYKTKTIKQYEIDDKR